MQPAQQLEKRKKKKILKSEEIVAEPQSTFLNHKPHGDLVQTSQPHN